MARSKGQKNFPGFEACMAMMRKRNPQTRDDGFEVLFDQASKFVPELLEEFEKESDHGLKCSLLYLLGEARDTRTLELFRYYLRHEDDSFRDWAAYGLNKLNTKEARQILWEARSYQLPTEDETRRFREMLDRLKS
jgi:HEAT repeat protein